MNMKPEIIEMIMDEHFPGYSESSVPYLWKPVFDKLNELDLAEVDLIYAYLDHPDIADKTLLSEKLQKLLEIVQRCKQFFMAVKKAHEEGLYEVLEHYASSVDLGLDKDYLIKIILDKYFVYREKYEFDHLWMPMQKELNELTEQQLELVFRINSLVKPKSGTLTFESSNQAVKTIIERLVRSEEIFNAVKEAEDKGLYEANEDFASSIDLETDDDEDD